MRLDHRRSLRSPVGTALDVAGAQCRRSIPVPLSRWIQGKLQGKIEKAGFRTAGSEVGRPPVWETSQDLAVSPIYGIRELEFAMHPILLFNPSLALKIVIAVITIVALVLFIRAYGRSGKL